MTSERPTTLLAELTHRCPLHCPYCSNPLDLVRAEREISTEDWKRVITEARALGVLQLGLSGGEPLVRKDTEELAAHARSLGLYSTLVTSGLGLTRPRAEKFREAGLEHIQISLQDADDDNAERIAGRALGEAEARGRGPGARARVRLLGQRRAAQGQSRSHPADHRPGREMGADRLELANTQYYGWGLVNRDALMPTREQVDRAFEIAERAKQAHRGRMQILFVLPDYYEEYPKACYGGWGKVYLVVTPDGKVLPCHGATNITTIAYPNVREHSMEWIWQESPLFNAFRGDSWMKSPCSTCERKCVDFGGCRCQAFALTGDAAMADPICTLSPHHHIIESALADANATTPFTYRKLSSEPQPA